MPIGYLVSVSLFALCTLMALSPIRRPHALGWVSLLLGLLFSELPLIALFLLVLTAVSNVGQQGLDAPAAWLAAGCLTLLVMIGLAVIVRRELRAGPVLEHAMVDALGVDWRGTLDAGMAARLRRRLPYTRILFAPIPFRRRDVERLANIRYGDAGRSNLLDVYRHRSRPSGGPVLIHLHGGAFVMGKKNREARPLLYRLASQGWVCISANYRLGREGSRSGNLIDVKKVIAWVREHGHELGADPAVVFVAGSSAGAHLAAQAALTPNDPSLQPGFQGAETSVSAAILLYGYYGALDTDPRMGSSTRLDAPPFFVAHGGIDSLLPAETARRFSARLRSSSSDPVLYAELPGAQHGFDLFHSIRFESVVDAIEAFAVWVRSREDLPVRPVG